MRSLRPRAGAQVLAILATPLNSMILRALADRPMRLAELRRAAGLPAQTTLRGYLSQLAELGVLSKRPTTRMPYAVENELTPAGRAVLDVADHLEAWLGLAPERPISLESGSAHGVIKAYADGWGSMMMRRIAVEPMSLTELDRRIPDLSYSALERRLSSMRMAGLIEPRPGSGAGTPYTVTDWARRGTLSLIAAADCELRHLRGQGPPIAQHDIEAAFMLATPLVGLPAEANGSCRLAVEVEHAQEQVGVQVAVDRGRVVSCDCDLGATAGTFASGSAARWFRAIKDGTAQLLRFGGSRQLSEGLVIGLHAALVER